MVIRPAHLDDAAALARVLIDTGRIAHQGQVPDDVLTQVPLEKAYAESAHNWARALREIAEDASPHECLYVAEDEQGVVVALAMGGPSREDTLEGTGEIYALYVQQSHQGRGLGRRLLQTVSAHLARLGMTGLELGCLSANTPARRFYEQLGGRVIRERIIDQDGTMLPGVVYGWRDTRVLMAAS